MRTLSITEPSNAWGHYVNIALNSREDMNSDQLNKRPRGHYDQTVPHTGLSTQTGCAHNIPT
jgi:hypothetical protein